MHVWSYENMNEHNQQFKQTNIFLLVIVIIIILHTLSIHIPSIFFTAYSIQVRPILNNFHEVGV